MFLIQDGCWKQLTVRRVGQVRQRQMERDYFFCDIWLATESAGPFDHLQNQAARVVLYSRDDSGDEDIYEGDLTIREIKDDDGEIELGGEFTYYVAEEPARREMIRAIAIMCVEEGDQEVISFADSEPGIFADWLEERGRTDEAGQIRAAQ